MTRKLWKWLFGVSLTLLILFTLFTFSIWALGNGAGAFAAALLPGDVEYNYYSLEDFLNDFVGSPLFYACLAAGTGLIASVVGLAIQKNKSYKGVPMHHQMRLSPAPFEMIKCGQKSIELRLWDEKRRQIKVGDTLCFTNTQHEQEQLYARVTALHRFDSFAALYAALPLLSCGYDEESIQAAHPSDMDAYYSPAKQKEYGVVGIELLLISSVK